MTERRTGLETTGRFAIGLGIGLVAGTVLSAVIAVMVFVYSGGPLANEWICEIDEYPATSGEGGKSCFDYGEPVPEGWTADRDGNQPMDRTR